MCKCVHASFMLSYIDTPKNGTPDCDLYIIYLGADLFQPFEKYLYDLEKCPSNLQNSLIINPFNLIQPNPLS